MQFFLLMNLSEGYFKVLKKASVFGISVYNIIVNISVIFFRKKKIYDDTKNE